MVESYKSNKVERIFEKMNFKDSIRWQSKSRLFGNPLVSVAWGPDNSNDEKFGHAKGIIAIGQMATGIVAIGFVSYGIISIGLISLGLISFSWFVGLGLFSFSGLAFGLVAVGGAAIGFIAWGYGYWICGNRWVFYRDIFCRRICRG